MTNTQANSLAVYKELADHYERQKQPAMRDRFLVLAADAAWKAGQHEEAEQLRQRLLQANPHHLLKPYSSFAQALQAPDAPVAGEVLEPAGQRAARLGLAQELGEPFPLAPQRRRVLEQAGQARHKVGGADRHVAGEAVVQVPQRPQQVGGTQV